MLSVERARKQEDDLVQAGGGQSGKDVVSLQLLAKETNMKIDDSDSFKFRSVNAGEPIAPRLGIEYPFAPHLE